MTILLYDNKNSKFSRLVNIRGEFVTDINIDSDIYINKEINKFIEKSKEFCNLNKLKYNDIQSLYFYMKKLNSYIQKYFPQASINVEHVNEDTVKAFYEKLKGKSLEVQEKLNINISPEVLYKMKKDGKYARNMIGAIAKCSEPKSFKEFQLMLYDYNIFIKSDGSIEVVSCGDADYDKMSKDRNKLRAQQAASKASIRERINALKSVIYGRYVYANNHLKLIASDKSAVRFIPYEYFLNQNSELRRLMEELCNM